MAERLVHVLVVTDDQTAACSVLRLMHIAWERDGSWHRRCGLRIKWRIEDGGLDQFKLPGEWDRLPAETEDDASDHAFSQVQARGALDHLTESVDMLRGCFELDIDARTAAIVTAPGSPRTLQVRVCLGLVKAHYFAGDERVGRERVEKLLASLGQGEGDPDDFIVLGITDASLNHPLNPKVGSGVDQILTPGLVEMLSAALPVPLRVGVAITGLERDFARFDVSDPFWSRYGSAHAAAWDPRLIQSMLHAVLSDRPHLINLMQNDSRFRRSLQPIAFSAVIPCGFLRNWGCVNYNAWEPGWIEGSPSIRGEREAPYMVPHHCADPLLTALTGLATDFQLTPMRFARMRPVAPSIQRSRL